LCDDGIRDVHAWNYTGSSTSYLKEKSPAEAGDFCFLR
jgi:hypothetical protein